MCEFPISGALASDAALYSLEYLDPAVSPVDGPEGEELREPWNQVFHIRTVHKHVQEEPLLPPSVRGEP